MWNFKEDREGYILAVIWVILFCLFLYYPIFLVDYAAEKQKGCVTVEGDYEK